MKFSIKDLFSNQNPQFSADLVTFTEEIFYGKLHFSCSVWYPQKLGKINTSCNKNELIEPQFSFQVTDITFISFVSKYLELIMNVKKLRIGIKKIC